MKLWLGVFVLCLVTLVSGQSGEELPLAEPCDPEACQLPDCRCSSTEIPGGLAARDTPQFVLVTFDDAVTTLNMETYREVLYNRFNANGCPAKATFYVCHEYTNYQAVNELYNQGFEIALHSISHKTNQTYWQQASYDDMMREFGDQRPLMARYANLPENAFKGTRMPFLQMAGNSTFEVLKNVSMLYDSSWSTSTFLNPGLWPYTLDYQSIQECPVPPCPTASIPGPWVKPMISWIDNSGFPCAMVDACFDVPNLQDEEAWFQFIVRNFERHYLGNRAPFGFYAHEWYVAVNPAVRRALIRFLDMINIMQDVYMVPAYKAIEWSRNPVPLRDYDSSDIGRCTFPEPRPCPATSCGPVPAEHTDMNYWMSICAPCPRVYPWLGNPLGL